MTNKELKYYAVILGSVLDILAIIGGIVGALYFLLTERTLGGFTTSSGEIQRDFSTLYIVLFSMLAIAGIVLYPILTKSRQSLRDEVEYDENGNSKKYNSLKKMSGKDRDVIERQRMMESEKTLDSATMRKITHEGVKNPQEELDKLIGLEETKTMMNELIAKMQFEKQKWKDDGGKGQFHPTDSMSMIFMGPAGTGKTTVARIMAGFLYQNGYIRKNQCVEVDGNFLKGRYVGESAKKTSMLIQKSMGGVLFIDEAYALLTGSGGDEAIATLIKEMEDHRDDIVFIFAGYETEMKNFINSNPGIASRIKHYLWFGNYSMKNFQEMFLKLAHTNGYKVSTDYLKEFVERMKYEQRQRNFGNARTVRNIYEKTIDKHAVNVANGTISEDKRYCICSCDIPSISVR
jgi:stage V sporulation protein K